VSGLGISQTELSEWDGVALISIAQHLDCKSPASPVLTKKIVSKNVTVQIFGNDSNESEFDSVGY
jgi:hypothetical protein